MSEVSFITLLKEEFRAIVVREHGLHEDYLKAGEALNKIYEQRKLISQLLESRGIDPDTLAMNFEAHEEQDGPQGLAEDNGQLPLTPVNNTHAVFALMKKYANEGFTAARLAAYAKKAGLTLTADDITKVFWRQTSKQNMQKTENGLYKLTPKGFKTTKFRRQKASDESAYKPMI